MPSRYLGPLVLGVGLLAAPSPADAASPVRKEVLEKTLRRLEKDIAAVRGLAFKKPVVAHVIPRPRGASRSLQGYYSTRDKALYLYDDLSGSYQRGVLVHEMVHALQDQHFCLDRLH